MNDCSPALRSIEGTTALFALIVSEARSISASTSGTSSRTVIPLTISATSCIHPDMTALLSLISARLSETKSFPAAAHAKPMEKMSPLWVLIPCVAAYMAFSASIPSFRSSARSPGLSPANSAPMRAKSTKNGARAAALARKVK